MECFIGRDTREEQLDKMIHKLEHWFVSDNDCSYNSNYFSLLRCLNCASVVNSLETQIARANDLKREKLRQKDMTEKEVCVCKHMLPQPVHYECGNYRLSQ